MLAAARRPLAGALAALGAYRLGLALAALGEGPPAPPRPPRMRVAVLIPAHDEERSISRAVDSLHADAERHELSVFVVADNCTDRTARRGGAAGARVLERADPGNPGKSPALNWALERIAPGSFDAVCFLDADCWVEAGFLDAVLGRIADGAEAVQADYRIATEGAPPTGLLRAAGYLLSNTVRPRGKERLGLSAGLYGSGMAFSGALAAGLRWPEESIVEDAALSLELVESGRRVRFAAEGRAWSETPGSYAGARSQVERWDAGRAALVRARFAPALRGAIAARDPRRIHAALELLVPPESLVALANLVLLGLAAASRRPGRLARAVAVAALQPAFVLTGLRAAGAPPAVYRALGEAPRLVAERLALYAGLARRGAPRGFVRTARGDEDAAL